MNSTLFYKYTRQTHLASILGNGTLAFPFFHQLNDPFESAIESTMQHLRNDILEITFKERESGFVMKLPGHMAVDAINPYWDKAQPKRKHNTQVAQHNNSLHEILEHLTWYRANVGICALTARPDDMVMWAHYAGNGTGACIGLDMSGPPFTDFFPKDAKVIDDVDLFRPNKVSYEEERPSFSGRTKSSYARTAFFTKFSPWSYEQEVRLLRPISECHFIDGISVPLSNVPRTCIREANLGAAASPSVLEYVLKLIEDLPHVSVRQVQILSNEYKVSFREVRAARDPVNQRLAPSLTVGVPPDAT